MIEVIIFGNKRYSEIVEKSISGDFKTLYRIVDLKYIDKKYECYPIKKSFVDNKNIIIGITFENGTGPDFLKKKLKN